jgi:hypothetical protein
MTNSQPQSDKASSKQIRYIKDLWRQLGETGTLPRTRAQASAEIKRLLGRKRLTPAERRREAFEARRGVGGIPGDDAAVRRIEVGGYGSTAHWRLRG